MEAVDRGEGEKAAQLGQAARVLSRIGVRVCIDCYDDAYSKKKTERETVFLIEPMSNYLMKQLPSYVYLSEMLESQESREKRKSVIKSKHPEEKMLDVILNICGGKITLLEDFKDKVMKVEHESKSNTQSNKEMERINKMKKVIKENAVDLVFNVVGKIKEILRQNSNIGNVLEYLKDHKSISRAHLAEMLSGQTEQYDLKGWLRVNAHGNYVLDSGILFIAIHIPESKSTSETNDYESYYKTRYELIEQVI